MRLSWSIQALIDFDEAQAYIAEDNPFAAQTVADRIWQASRRLPEQPQMGRPGVVPGTREWVVQRTPYVLVYRVKGEVVEIVRLWHGRRNWKA